MRCDEIQERFIDLLYSEKGTPPASRELQAHIDSCPVCRKQLEELKEVRGSLHLWKDEAPLHPVRVPLSEGSLRVAGSRVWSAWRYAAIAAMLFVGFLILSNPDISLSRQGFSFKTNMPWGASGSDYYTKAEVRDIIKRALDDSEAQTTETTRLMMERLLDTIDQERMMDLRLARHEVEQNRNKN